MARKLTYNQTEVGFEVKKIEKARKDGYVVTYVKYQESDQIYTYVRRAFDNGTHKYTVVDGCKIEYTENNSVLTFKKAIRLYDTSGRRKMTNPGKAGRGKEEVKKAPQNRYESVTASNVKVSGNGEWSKGENKKDQEQNWDCMIVHHEKYDTIKMCLESNIPAYLAGPAGSGKNHTVEQIADELGWEFYFSNSVQQEYKLTGFIDAGGKYHETEFYKACTSKKECVFFLDEMDASIPEVLVLINAAIANGYFEFPCGRVEFENVHFVAAGNTVGLGADDMYTGRMVIDQATLDRFAIIDFDYSYDIEMVLSRGNKELVSFVHDLRAVSKRNGVRATFSYRCIMMVTKLESAGMGLGDILRIAVMKGLDKDTINTFRVDGESKYYKALMNIQGRAA